MKSHPYYIVAPDYRDSSAGIRVMHRLCHSLNALGYEAYIAGAQHFHTDLQTPPLDEETKTRHRHRGRVPIAVYSDIVTGNPLVAQVCVRYMLNKEGVIAGNAINAGPDDLFFYYSRAFTPDASGKFDYLKLQTHDLDLFKPDPECLKKGPLLYLNRIPPSAIDFTSLPPEIELLSNQNPLGLAELAKKLQSATALYSYESSTTCTLAMLCGCPVIAMTLAGYEQLGFSSQSLSIYGGRGYALTDAESDLRIARDSLPRMREGTLKVARVVQNEIAAFIAKTQRRAEEIAQNPTLSLLSDNAYQDWITARSNAAGVPRYEPIALGEANRPRFHLLVVHDRHTDLELARTLRSLSAQQFSPIVVSVSSPLPAPAGLNPRRLQWFEGEQVWTSASLALSNTEAQVWVGLIMAGDAVAPEAFLALAQHLDARSNLRAIYTDEDIIEDFGTRHSPRFKPDFDPRLLRETGYIGGLLLARNDVWQAAGGWRHLPDYEDEFDLALRLSKIVPAEAFGHLPDVLYHRSSRHPALKNLGSADDVHLPESIVVPSPQLQHESSVPLVSILIPTRDQLPALQRCIETLFEQTQQTPFELILVDHESKQPDALAFLAGLPAVAPDRIQVVKARGDFNFSALINLATRHARGEYLLLLNNDIAALHPEWLPVLLAEMATPEVGIVAPRLVFPDGRIQHAGAVLGLSGAVDYPWVGRPMDDAGYLGLLKHPHAVSAVSGAALLIRQTLFESLSGMDEDYAIAFGDIDLCIRAAQRGYRCIWTPHATLMHEAGLTLKDVFSAPDDARTAQERFVKDRHTLLKRWLPRLARDPAYNINLSLNSRQFELETEPVLQPFASWTSNQPRVLALPADDSGSGEYRVALPVRESIRSGFAACRLARAYPLPVLVERLGARTLFSQRQVDDNHLTTLATLRDLMPHLHIVMDFDDLLTEASPHSFYHQSVWQDMPRRLAELARLSNCFTVSTEPLAAAMHKYHDRIVTIRNGIDPAQWARVARGPRDLGRKLRVGWVGGYSHAGDLALLRQVIAPLSDEVDWIMLGMCLEETKRYLKEFHPAVPYAEYPAKFASLDLDLALAPLEITHFNECKSNLRLLENGILGIPVIATDITPYQCGLPVTLVKNDPASWIRTIRERIGEFDALAKEGETLRNAVLADWTIHKMLPAWLSAWR